MEIQLIRNATVKIKFGNKTWLIDPFLGDVNSLPPFAGKSDNPTVPLPFTISEILEDVDYVLITHLHPDHFDSKAKELIPKTIPFIVQAADAQEVKSFGFENVKSIDQEIIIDTIKISRVTAQHGEGDILKVMGHVSGYILEADQEQTLYITGDTIWCDSVKNNLDKFQPDIIICNAGGNSFYPESNPFKTYLDIERSYKVIMDEKQVLELLNYRDETTVITVHMGALDHETVSREQMKEFIKASNIDMKRLRVPEDGEVIKLN
ncbi:MBL fold metallo-hydrolase [uncultured Arcticibacterium sp.]|uniref:MBL fold metallo-hydrolase n=1 Tax=uncultured Arcticibacterium sp. TaxID=2173042 RepID=UPI0030F715FD